MKILIRAIAFLLSAGLAATSAYAGEIDSSAFIAAHNKWRAKVGVKEKLSYSPIAGEYRRTHPHKIIAFHNKYCCLQ